MMMHLRSTPLPPHRLIHPNKATILPVVVPIVIPTRLPIPTNPTEVTTTSLPPRRRRRRRRRRRHRRII